MPKICMEKKNQRMSKRQAADRLLDRLLQGIYKGANTYTQECYGRAMDLYSNGDFYNAAKKAYEGIFYCFGKDSKECLEARDMLVRAGFRW